MSVGAVYILAAVPFMLGLLYVLQVFYLSTSRQLRLLDLEAKSPLYTHFSETLEGLATIQSFGWQHTFRQRMLQYLDASQRPSYLLYAIQRWLNVVLSLIVAAIAILLVALSLQLNLSAAGSVGVGLISLLTLNENLAVLIMSWTSLETSLGAIARVRDFEKETPQEVSETSPSTATLMSGWPQDGKLEFQNVSASYG